MSAIGVLVVVLTGCASAGDLIDSAPSERQTEDPGPGPGPGPTPDPEDPAVPEVDACRVLTLDDIAPAANDDPAVPCSKRHTAVTYHVAEWPTRLVSSARGVEDQQLSTYALDACERTWRRTVGGSDEAWTTSIVSWAWYKPTPDQFADGAHWFRCDLVAGQNTAHLEELPAQVDGLLDGDFDDRYHACWTKPFSNKPNADEGHLTSCERRHQQRAIGTVRIGRAKADYPGERAAFDKANRLCGDLVAKWRDDRRPGPFGLQWPRRADWKGGERDATCWAVTRK
jgi:hypothetical protein